MNIILAFLFTRSFLTIKNNAPFVDKIILSCIFLTIITAVLAFFVEYNVIAPVAVLLSIIMPVVKLFIGFYCYVRGFKAARFYLLGWTFFLLGSIALGMNKYDLFPRMFLTENSQQIGSILTAFFLSFALGDRIDLMEQKKQHAEDEAVQAREQFKFIIEKSNDVFFTTDLGWKINFINDAVKDLLQKTPEQLIGKSFFELLYYDHKSSKITKKFLRDQLVQFLEDKQPMNFKAQFVSAYKTESKTLQVRLEYLPIKGETKIFGKISNIVEDSLLKYFINEKQEYVISNYLTTVEEMSHRLTRNVAKFCDDCAMLRMALLEVLINAIEHGNLDISFEEKSLAHSNSNYFQLFAERQNHPDYKNKKVHIEYIIDVDKVTYVITDEGKGFNHIAFFENVTEQVNAATLTHGRGLLLIDSIFDEVTFNEKGNSIKLVKFFS